MKPFLISQLHEISELVSTNTQVTRNLQRLKKELDILVIDDGNVPFLDILKQNDYQIKHYTDLTDLKAVTDYAVILCDIQGVGKKLNPTLQGGHIVKEIKKLFPFKQVIAFSANTGDALIMDSVKSADNILKKDADIDQWISALDNCLENYSNPVRQWIQIRNLLLSNHVSTKTVSILESEFVSAVTKKNPQKFLANRSDYKSLISDALWDVLKQFSASVLTKAILGV